MTIATTTRSQAGRPQTTTATNHGRHGLWLLWYRPVYFRHKRVEERVPGTTMLSEEALVMFSEDGMTVNMAIS